MVIVNEEFESNLGFDEGLLYGKSSPLPRLSKDDGKLKDKYEAVIVGAGPAGLFLTLLLARYGLAADSVLCIDSKSRFTRTGHADGIHCRTLEILRTLGLEGIILREACPLTELTIWTRTKENPDEFVKQAQQPVFWSPSRYPQLLTIHQGRIERMFLEDAENYGNTVSYSTTLSALEIDEQGDADYPVKATIVEDGKERTVRTRYLVGADGAHSVVRQGLDIAFEGETTDRVWGVIDFVAESDFPDIRRMCTFPSYLSEGRGTSFLIPREKIGTGDYLTRFYTDMGEYGDTDVDHVTDGNGGGGASSTSSRAKRAQITQGHILGKFASAIRPYSVKVKDGTKPIWWASFVIGQRLAANFAVKDSKGEPRVFLMGDACHTHSPSQGQGLNISVTDAHNLSWKLAHAILGLSSDPIALLNTYEEERRDNADRVLFNDKRWNQGNLTAEEKYEEMRATVLGCGVEYNPSLIVDRPDKQPHLNPVKGTAYLDGILRSGRRLFNVPLKRYADGAAWDIQDSLASDGRYRVIVICSNDMPEPEGRSCKATLEILKSLERFPEGLLEPVILIPDSLDSIQWTEMPEIVKKRAEMNIFGASAEAYATYGVEPEEGAIVVVRPDGMVGLISKLEDSSRAYSFLQRPLRVV